MGSCFEKCLNKKRTYNVRGQEEQNAEVDKPEEESQRGYWSHKMDFILSTIGFAVGLGNVWRFPYLCYKNGGGAFLIPYIIMLVLAGIPLFYLELAFGQFASLGCLTVWKICPLFKGLGYGMVIVTALVTIYYNVVICYTVFYAFASLTSELPWVGCYHGWNTLNCYDGGSISNYSGTKPVWSSEEYYTRFVLDMSDNMNNIGKIRWELALSLLFCWIIVYLCIIKGVKSSGKVVYFTATFPYVILTILLIRGVTLPGAADGIKFYLTPRWELLLEPTVWKDAATQIFYSLGVAFGAIITFSSYNKFNNNACRDALIVSLVNCGTSLYAGFVIFSTLGFMAHGSDIPVSEVVDEGPGLAFVVYPEAISRLPGAPFWSFIFFFMLFTLGLDSQFAMMETVITAVFDELPKKISSKKPLITGAICFIFFLLGLPCTTRGGIYVLTLMDWYSAGFSLFFIATMMCVVISYIYGIRQFGNDISSMMPGILPNSVWWKACWMVISPLIMIAVMIFSFVKYTPASYSGYVFPPWAEAVGWLVAMSSILVIPGYMIIPIMRGHGNILQRLQQSLQPSWDWGPALNSNRVLAGYKALPGSIPEINVKTVPNAYQTPPLPRDKREHENYPETDYEMTQDI